MSALVEQEAALLPLLLPPQGLEEEVLALVEQEAALLPLPLPQVPEEEKKEQRYAS